MESSRRAGLRKRSCGGEIAGALRNLCIRADASQDQVSFPIVQQIFQFSFWITGKIQPDRLFHRNCGSLNFITEIRRIHIVRVCHLDDDGAVFFLSFQTVFQKVELKAALLKVCMVCLSGFGQGKCTAGAGKQAAAKLRLQLPDLFADGWLTESAWAASVKLPYLTMVRKYCISRLFMKVLRDYLR